MSATTDVPMRQRIEYPESDGKPPFQGFKLEGDEFIAMAPDADGALVSHELGLRIYRDGAYLRLIDLASGQQLLAWRNPIGHVAPPRPRLALKPRPAPTPKSAPAPLKMKSPAYAPNWPACATKREHIVEH
jgi:hypothetical protein